MTIFSKYDHWFINHSINIRFSLLYFPSVICFKCPKPANCTLCLRLLFCFSLLCFPHSFPSLWMWPWTRKCWGISPSAPITVHGVISTWTPLSESSLLPLAKVPKFLEEKIQLFLPKTILRFWNSNDMAEHYIKCSCFSRNSVLLKWSSFRSPWSRFTKVYASCKWLSEYRWSSGSNELVPEFYWHPFS